MAERGRVWSKSKISALLDICGDDLVQRQNSKRFFSADTIDVRRNK